MKEIKQKDDTWNLKLDIDESYYHGEWFLDIQQGKDIVKIKKDGAPQLIETLKEFVGDQKTMPLHYYPEYDETIDYPSDALVRHNGEVKLATSIKGIC